MNRDVWFAIKQHAKGVSNSNKAAVISGEENLCSYKQLLNKKCISLINYEVAILIQVNKIYLT